MTMGRLLVSVVALAPLACGCTVIPGIALSEPTDAFPTSWEGVTSEKAQAEAKERDAVAADDKAFADAEAVGSFDAFVAYLEAHPSGAHRREAVTRAYDHAQTLGDTSLRDAALDQLVRAAPEAVQSFPVEHAVLFVGPPQMRVKDIFAMRAQGLGDDVISSTITAGEHGYKEFTLAELTALKSLGMPDPIVKAMITSHAAAAKSKKAQDEKAALQREIAELRKMVEQQRGAPGAASGGPTVTTANGPMDAAACAAARLTALKACEPLPWPGSTLCQSAAESQFPCGE